MKKFNNIAIINPVKLTEAAVRQLQSFSVNPITFPTHDPKNEQETIARIGDADAIMGSWNLTITETVLRHGPNVRYIGVCGTNIQNIDTAAVQERGITLKNVTDYGDEATAEYIFTQLLSVARGFGPHQWKKEPTELNGKTIGIVGLGAVGQQVARLALGFNMRVHYYSRTRKPKWEAKGLTFAPLPHLLQQSDIITLHVPKNMVILTAKEFAIIPAGTIFVDTCLGIVCDPVAFREWVGRGTNLVIMDDVKHGAVIGTPAPKNVIGIGAGIAGITIESQQRLSKKVLDNISRFLTEGQ